MNIVPQTWVGPLVVCCTVIALASLCLSLYTFTHTHASDSSAEQHRLEDTPYLRLQPKTSEAEHSAFIVQSGKMDTEKLHVTGLTGLGNTNPQTSMHATITDHQNNQTSAPARLTHSTFGSPQTGIGTGLEYEVQTSSTNHEVGGITSVTATQVTPGAENFQFVVSLQHEGQAPAPVAQISSTGALTVTNPAQSSFLASGTSDTFTGDTLSIGVGSTLHIPDGAELNFKNTTAGFLRVADGLVEATQITDQVSPLHTFALVYNSNTQEIIRDTAKSFVINHPLQPETHYLKHACLEGPEAGVYYRGTGAIDADASRCFVTMPEYACAVAHTWTIQLTPISDVGHTNRGLTASHVDSQSGGFWVYGTPGEFFWLVMGQRLNFEVEPLKSENQLLGDGPYTYLKAH